MPPVLTQRVALGLRSSALRCAAPRCSPRAPLPAPRCTRRPPPLRPFAPSRPRPARCGPSADSLLSTDAAVNGAAPPAVALPAAADAVLGALERGLVDWQPPSFVWRAVATALLAGQVVSRVLRRSVHLPNLQEQLRAVGPATLGVTLLTSAFVGMVFTIQFVREFARLGLTRSVGGVLSLAFSRELTPVISAIILAGRCGSAIAAELGTMAVSEQTESLRVLRTDPVDYLVVPRVLACAIAAPLLSLLAFTVSLAAAVMLADVGYGVPPNVILESACKALVPWDVLGMGIKSTAFGFLIATIACGWGSTTTGGAKGVGESTTSAVVLSLVSIFVADFFLSLLFFQGTGDALKRVVRHCRGCMMRLAWCAHARYPALVLRRARAWRERSGLEL